MFEARKEAFDGLVEVEHALVDRHSARIGVVAHENRLAGPVLNDRTGAVDRAGELGGGMPTAVSEPAACRAAAC